MIVYGRNPVREALRGPRHVGRIWATKNAAREPWLPAAPEPRSRSGEAPAVTIESAEQIEARCGSPAHQGICAEVSPFRYLSGPELLSRAQPLVVALDQVQDPQNLGAICRVAECAGADGVVVLERRSAAVTPAVCKASAGAVEHLPVARIGNLADFLHQAKARSLWCYGAEAGASVSYEEVEFTGGAVLVFGSEGRGLRPRVAAACDLVLSIPVHGKIPSLSVATAAAVLLYAAASQRAAAGA